MNIKKIHFIFMLCTCIIPTTHKASEKLWWQLNDTSSDKPKRESEATQALLLDSGSDTPHYVTIAHKKYIYREDFIKDVLGFSEKKLQRGIFKASQNEIRKFIHAYPNRAAIFHGAFECKTIQSLTNTHVFTKGTPPRFNIRLHIPTMPERTDIRVLASDPESKFAAFQSASTLYFLEGGMAKKNAQLVNMLHAPVQGEELAIVTAGRSIRMKYGLDKSYYTMVEKVGLSLNPDGGPRLYQLLQQRGKPFNAQDIPLFQIGIYKDAVVSLGQLEKQNLTNNSITPYYGRGKLSAQQTNERLLQYTLPIKVTVNGTIDDRHTQIIHIICVAAHDVKNALAHVSRITYQEEQHYTQLLQQNPASYKQLITIRTNAYKDLEQGSYYDYAFARTLLNASYEGTFKAAKYIFEEQIQKGRAVPHKLFLTIVGGGAFRNATEWIADAITTKVNADTIHDGALEATFIYRPETQKSPWRLASSDLAFLKQLVTFADTVNKTNYTHDAVFQQHLTHYIESMYGLRPDLDFNELAYLVEKLEGISLEHPKTPMLPSPHKTPPSHQQPVPPHHKPAPIHHQPVPQYHPKPQHHPTPAKHVPSTIALETLLKNFEQTVQSLTQLLQKQ